MTTRPLVEADHAAWMSSIEHIRSTPGFGRGRPPAAGMTLAQNPADMESHAGRSAELDGPLTDVVGAWLREAWPFEVVHYR